MSDERHPQRDPQTPAETAALEAVRALRSTPASDVARARARRAFLAADPSGSTTSAPPRRPNPRRGGWVAAVLTAAATLALFLHGSRPVEPWSVLDPGPSGEALREGRPVPLEAGEALAPGPLLVPASDEIELSWGALRLRTLGDTRFELPSPPGRWFGRDRVLYLTEGQVFGSSGASGPGFELNLVTPEATARLTGTTFAVFRTGEATCFCLYRGGLAVTPTGTGEEIDLPVGHRMFVYRDGRAPSIETLEAGEQMKLQMIDDAALADAVSDTDS